MIKMWRKVEQGEASWLYTTENEQQEVDEAVAMLREAADQGHKEAQARVGELYTFGMGVEKDERVAFEYTEKVRLAIQQSFAPKFGQGLPNPNYR